MINVFETSFEARERRFQIEKLYHGETVDLVGVVTTDGVLKNITGYSVQGVFQPTSQQGSEDFYELSADIVDNKVVVHWEKGKDFGEPSYMVWALLTDGDDASYPIAWRLDMAYSPNFPLSALDPIPKTIDFSKYELLNAPWAMLSDFQDLQEDVSELSDGLSAYAKKEEIPEVEGKYLPLSGGEVTGTLSVDGTIGASNFKAGDAGSIMIGYNARAKSGSIAIGSSSDVTNAHFGSSNVAIGTAAKIGSSSETDCAVAVGIGATVDGNHGIAIGHSATAEGANSIAIGSSGSRVQALAPESIQIGGLSNGLWTPNNTPHSLKVFDKMVLSGDNLTLDPERVPYLSNYAEKEELTAYAQLSDIPELPEDIVRKDDLSVYAQLSDLENIDVPEISACLSSNEFTDVEELGAAETVSFQDLVDKLNMVIQKLKRTWRDPTKTYLKYLDGTINEFEFTGALQQSQIPNVGNVVDAKIGNTVTSLWYGSPGWTGVFTNCSNLTSVSIPESVTSIGKWVFYGTSISSITIPNSVTSIGEQSFQNCSSLMSITIPSNVTTIERIAFNQSPTTVTFADRTVAEVQGMGNYPWGIPTGQGRIICTDGTL